MAKSRSFSIYLLKEGYDATNSLRKDHKLDKGIDAVELPEGATLFLLDSKPKPPWWKSYFGIEKDIKQVSKGALVFLPVAKRCFALSFGYVAHNLTDTSYEYDFGLRVTLNSLDPQKLKSTDTLDPGVAKRQRTQRSIEAELTLFDFDRDSTILKSLTGKVRAEYKELFKHATGASNLRLSSEVTADELVELCAKLLGLYQSEQYKTAFPEIQNIVPVRDPEKLKLLNERLLKAFHSRAPDLNITVPEIVNYSDNLYITFSGAGQSSIYDDVYIGRYYDYLDERKTALTSIKIDDLRRHALVLADEEGNARDRYSIFKSLVFDTALSVSGGETFHLCDGNWYRIDDSYIARLAAYLDPLCVDSDLPSYDHSSEGDYNIAVAKADAAIACLDKKTISPDGQTPIEPCDLLALRSGVAIFYHVKVSTLSAQLSHLFNQGVNAIELLKLEPQAIDKLEALLREEVDNDSTDALLKRIRDRNYRIVFGVVTKKKPEGRSLNLPLFSRISLMRNMKALQLMDVEGNVIFIKDEQAARIGRKKKRKKKESLPVEAGSDEALEGVE